MLRFLSKYKISTDYIPNVLIKMRVGGESNKSLKNVIRKSTEDLQAMRNNNIGGFLSLIFKNLSKVKQFIKKDFVTIYKFYGLLVKISIIILLR